MKKILCSLGLFLAAGPAFAVSWDQSDPMTGVQALLAEDKPAAPAAAPGPVAGRFPVYVLALEWEPAFCATPAGVGDPECAAITPDRFDASNLILHGLWPNLENDPNHAYAYCGVDPAVKAMDKPHNWANMPPVPLSDGLRDSLRIHMPGTASSLENHEWYTHGSCSGMAPEQFFTTADHLVTSFQQSRAGAYITAHAGQAIDSEALLAEFAKDFGDSSRSALTFNCIKGTNKLIELRVYLKNSPDIAAGFQGALAAAGPGDQGNCPQAEELVAPGAQ